VARILDSRPHGLCKTLTGKTRDLTGKAHGIIGTADDITGRGDRPRQACSPTIL
jgi:hypothetical protein